ncbi:MAG TPA: anaerobic sulfatase maturase [Smithellaceae bacterium]|nr:anaerobic sulfatase maturase [Smithellaceae bacterium]HRS89943.1 anaerobic sulfatase maturase [Smithellaceae bacterium]HRV26779.1 anaerobic sulfatase maturase [Smithellaceae bacterium]
MKKNTAPQSISLLVKPTSSLCNLSCAYCFYRRVKELYPETSTKMSRGVAQAMIRNTLSLKAPLNSFCWQGGEPLLMGLDFFRDVVAFEQKYSRTGQVIENSIQTNGLLLDDLWCEFLAKENFLVGISLDGPAHIHDYYRKDHRQEGTFNGVMQSIELMKKHGVQFNILCLLTDRNVKSPLEIYNFFRFHDFRYIQFINCFEIAEISGTLKPCSVRGEETGEFYIKLFDEWFKNDFFDVSVRFFEDILLYLVDGVKASCCYNSTCDSYLVVEYNGDCYPCDFFVFKDWKIGNLMQNDLRAIMKSPLRKSFASRKAEISEICRKCSIASFCKGDCIRFRYLPTNGYKNISEYCAAIKMLYNHIEPKLPEIRLRVAAYRDGLV